MVLPFVEPWLSSEDIVKGQRWATDIARRLEESELLYCLRYARRSPAAVGQFRSWRNIEDSTVIPGLSPAVRCFRRRLGQSPPRDVSVDYLSKGRRVQAAPIPEQGKRISHSAHGTHQETRLHLGQGQQESKECRAIIATLYGGHPTGRQGWHNWLSLVTSGERNPGSDCPGVRWQPVDVRVRILS